MDETLFCPFTRQPCMERDCACAVYRYSRNVRTWKCGMVAHLDDDEVRNPILIEDERAYTGHVEESTGRD